MTTPVPPPDSSGNPMSLPQIPKNYVPQFKIDVTLWRSYWQKLFPNTQLTDLQIHQMTDSFVNFVWNQMNDVLKHAIETQKKLNQEQKEERGG